MNKSFDCLHRNTSVEGYHFLEASAGTGKTFAIEHIVARLLLEKENTSIQNILVVTFTKAAVRDLRMRIRSNLETISLCLQENSPDVAFDYLIPFFEKEKRKKALLKIEEALFFFDNNQIFTIHSFCYRMLQDCFLEADLSFATQDTKEKKKILYQKIKELLRYHLTEDIITPSQWKILQKKEKEEKSLLDKFLNNPPFSEKIKTAKELWKELSDTLLQAPSMSDLEAKLFSSLAHYKIASFSQETLLSEIHLLSKIVKEKSCSYEEFDKLIETGASLFEFFEESNKKQRAPKDLSFPELSILKNLLKPIVDKAIHPQNIFHAVAHHIYPSVEKTMEEEELFSHEYILRKMQKQIQNDAFLKKVQEKFQGVIVDEFQDTDPIQWDIFETLFVKKGYLQAFYLVGDPKQSIYGFRKADLATYFRAEKMLGPLAKGHLNHNFRSTPSLVNSLNHFFSEPFATQWLKLPEEQKNFSYLPVLAGLKEDYSFSDSYAPVHFILTEGSLLGKKWPSDEVKEEALFPYIASEIQKLHLQSSIPLSSMAVLVKDRYEQNALQTYLLQYSIPFSSKEHSLLIESFAFHSFVNLFQGIFFCQDVSKVKKAFLGPFWEGTLSEFSKYSEEILLQFFEWKNVIFLKGIVSFFETFLSFTWNGRSFSEILIQKKDFSFYQDTQKIQDLLLEFMHEKKRKPEDILVFFDELSQKDPEEHEEIKKNFSSEKEGIHIVTMHMSKGLEFDIVFALGVGTRTPTVEEGEKNDKEKLRQLYVALTRAKKRVYIPLAIDSRRKGCEKGTLAPLEIFLSEILFPGQNPYKSISEFSLEQIVSLLDRKPFFSVEILSEKLSPSCLEKESHVSLSIPEKESFLPWKTGTISSFSTMLHNIENKNISTPKIEIDKTEKILPLGAETGIFFHFLFETIFQSNSFYDEKIVESIIKKLAYIYSLEDFEGDIKKMVFSTFSTPLFPGGFCLKDLHFQKVRTEVPFFFEEKKDFFLKGSIDLLFFHEGKYYLLDWKTNFIPKDQNSSVKEKIENLMKEENYFLQASIYTEALRRLIGSSFDSFGGMFYIFLREMDKKEGIFHFIPDLFSSDPNASRQ